jgi:hypothetical protein
MVATGGRWACAWHATIAKSTATIRIKVEGPPNGMRLSCGAERE